MTCSHGHEGICLDDASPVERERFELAHRMAFAWATASSVPTAEQFAGVYAASSYLWDVEDWYSFPRYYEAWAKEEGLW